MHVIFPLLTTIFAIKYRSNTSCGSSNDIIVLRISLDYIHVPHTCHVVLERSVCFDKGANEMIIVKEFLERHSVLLGEVIGNIVVSAKHFQEFLTTFFDWSSAILNIRVARSVESGFDLFYLKYTIKISI